MCPIISQTENVTSRQRLALVNSLQRSPLFAFSSFNVSFSVPLFVYVYILLSLSNSVRHLCLSNHSLIRSLVYSVDLPDDISVVGGEHRGSLPLRNQDRRGR